MRNKIGVQQERYNTIGLLAHKNSIKGIRGITLIALVVTIVVLLILAGVAIQTIVGEDSIVHQVKQEKKNVETKQNMEQSYINSLEEELKKEKNTI